MDDEPVQVAAVFLSRLHCKRAVLDWSQLAEHKRVG